MQCRIENPVSGEVATLLETSEETGGERTLLEIDLAPGGGTTPHYHRTYSERFRALSGRLTIQVDGLERELNQGDEAEVPVGSRHSFRNRSAERAIFQVELRPGHEGFERALRVGYSLAAHGRTNRKSIPRNPLHTAVLLEWSEIRMPGIYAVLERPMRLLARVAHRRGADRDLERQYLRS